MTTNHHTPLPDSGSGQKPEMTGELFNTPLGELDAAITAINADSAIPGGRLTLTIGTPVLTADVTGVNATTIYYTPYNHSFIPLYDGASDWFLHEFSELSIAVPATTDTNYDVFVYDSSGTPTLEILAWTNDTTRSTAIVRQDGRYVKSGATTRLYLGSFRTTAVSGQCEMSFVESSSNRRLFVWNYYNQKEVTLHAASSASHTYNSPTWRSWNGTDFTFEWIVGVVEQVKAGFVLYARITGSGGPQLAISESNSGSGFTHMVFANVAGQQRNSVTRFRPMTVGYSLRYIVESGDAATPTFNAVNAGIPIWA